MNWLIGFVLMLVGILFAQEVTVLGAAVGFMIGWLIVSVYRLHKRADSFQTELFQAREAFRQLVAERDRLKQQIGAPAKPLTENASPVTTPPVIPSVVVAPVAQVPIASTKTVQEAAPNPNRAVFSVEEESVASPTTTQPPEIPKIPAASATTPSQIPLQVPRPSVSSNIPREPDMFERMGGAIKRWFTEGNVPVKMGIIVLFFGVAALLRYAYQQGVFTFPIEYRFIAVAIGGIAAIAWGWKERISNPAFGLSMQGGGIGILMLAIFAAVKYFPSMLPPEMAFGLIVVLVVCASMLAVLQDAIWIALLGLLGGYLAPVIISTGSGNHIALFSYYAVLNAAVFFIAWKKSWRVLNLMGFVFTFGVGTLWGMKYYVPEKFDTVEPFLILFFIFYTAIGLIYVIKQTEHRRPWIDGTLVFGTPLLSFPLQAYLMADNKMGLAFSALIIAMVYAGLVVFLHRRKSERLLAEAYGALALGFATLAIPLAFSAGTTATVWALEGVGVAWVGMRQNRKLPVFAGVLLQLLAAGAYAISFVDVQMQIREGFALVLNPTYLGAFILALSGFLLSYVFKSYRKDKTIPTLLFIWACSWWFAGGISDIVLASSPNSIGAWQYAVLYGAFTMLVSTLLMQRLQWNEMRVLAALMLCATPFFIIIAAVKYTVPFANQTTLYWVVWAAVGLYFLWRESRIAGVRNMAVASLSHLVWLWSIVLATYIQWQYQLQTVWQLHEGWYATALWLPLGLLTLGLWKKPQLFAWPMQEHFESYKNGWFIPAFVVLAFAWTIGLFMAGNPSPLSYVPILNPLELSLLAIVGLMAYYAREENTQFRALIKLWPVVAFAFVTMATLRTVHHWTEQPWNPMILNSGITQASLTIVWSLIGVSGLILGSRRREVKTWLAGGALMLVVLGKLAIVDRIYMGNIPGIVSCLAVGMLLVAVGYFAPRPPKNSTDDQKVGAV
jgi:uncharacterized membrane protein